MRMELCLLLIARMRAVGAWPVGKSCELSVVVLWSCVPPVMYWPVCCVCVRVLYIIQIQDTGSR